MASTGEFWGTVRALASRLAFWRRRDAPGSSWLARGLALMTLIAVVALRWWNPAPVEILRLKAFDSYQLIAPRDAKIGAVVIVDIDEESLAELGQWPWPRTVIARMVQNLMRGGVAAIGFDVVFAEPDRLSPGAIAGTVGGLDAGVAAALRKMPSNDEIFART
ncbi:MAG: CHASE2 domain-containing protein, partial [Alphaproteobacteria bacterium]